jgi:hypothetical protein
MIRGMSDIQLLKAIFTGVCALAERLTGERMTVFVDIGEGQTIALIGDQVRWEEASNCFGPLAEPNSMLERPLASHDAIERARPVSVQP